MVPLKPNELSREGAFASPERGSTSPGMWSDPNDAIDACFILPMDEFPGERPKCVGGEMNLQELEDDEETRTQIFLNTDGTVSCAATDGPPPVATCGLWQ